MTTPPKTTGLRRWQRWVLSFALCVGLVVVLLPHALRWGAIAWLERDPALSVRLDDVDFNPFRGQLSLYQLAVQRSGEPVLAVGEATVQLDWWPLLQRRIAIQEIVLRQGRIVVELAEDQPLIIGGFVLSQGDTLADDVAAEPTQPWAFSTGPVTADHVTVVYRDPQRQTALEIEVLHSSPLVSWQADQATTFDATFAAAHGTLQCSGEFSAFAAVPHATWTLSLNEVDLAQMTPFLSIAPWSDVQGKVNATLQGEMTAGDDKSSPQMTVHGQLQAKQLAASHPSLWLKPSGVLWQGDMSLVFAPDQPQVNVAGALQLQPVSVDLLSTGLGIAGDRLQWTGRVSLADAWQVNGQLEAAEVRVDDLTQHTTLIATETLDCGPVSVAQGEVLTIDQIQFDALKLLKCNAVEAPRQPQVVAVNSLSVRDLSVEPSGAVALAQVAVHGLQADVVRLSSGAAEARQWLPAALTQSDAGAGADGDSGGDTDPVPLVIGQIVVADSRVDFLDQSVTPPVAMTASALALEVRNIDNRTPAHRSAVSLDTRVDDYAHLTITGDVALFSQPLSLALTAELSDFSLPTVSGYVEQGFGYRIDQGHLTLHVDAPVDAGVARIDSAVTLKQLQVRALSAEDAANSAQRLGLSVPLALSLLRDHQGNIALDIPVRGDLSNPDIATGDVVRKAVFGALRNTVGLTLAPLGVVVKAGQWVGLGRSLEFEPLVCEAGSAEFTEAGMTYLARLAELLIKRPELTVSVCGQVTAADEAFWLRNRPLPDSPFSGDLIRQLGRQRGEWVKQVLIERFSVPTAQVLLCNPAAQLVEGAPGVRLRL